MSLERFRGRLPLLAFILLAVICVLLLGFACACLTDHPMQSFERALSVVSSPTAPIEAWPLIVLSLLAAALVGHGRRVSSHPSREWLQRFLL